jgi:5-methylcytosine-specific restriction endonuclease McrA
MSSFYKSKRWKRLRNAVLARDGYRCQQSARFGKNVPANTVHHIFPREDYPEYQWQPWNLVSLSSSAHDRMHDRGTRELTALGREWLERTARKQGIEIDNHDDNSQSPSLSEQME